MESRGQGRGMYLQVGKDSEMKERLTGFRERYKNMEGMDERSHQERLNKVFIIKTFI